MYQLVVFSVLSSALVSAAVDNNKPVSSSFAVRSDGDQKDFDMGRGYSKKYGYNKVVVTTYVVPKIMPAASYSTYIIHPVGVGMTPCGYTSMDTETSPSLQKVEIKTQDIPMKGYSVEDHTMDRRVIEAYSMNGKTMNDDNMEGRVMQGHAMKGYVVEGHSMDGYVIDGYEEGDVTGDETQVEPKFNENFYQDTAVSSPDEGWYKNEDYSNDEYWDKLRKQFDVYYDEQYKKLFGDQHPYDSNSWSSSENKPWIISVPELEEDNSNGKVFDDFPQKMGYVSDTPFQFNKGFSDYEPFANGYDDDFGKRIVDIRPKMTYMHGYEVYDKGFGDDALGLKKGYRFNNQGDFEFGYGLKDKYEPGWE